MIFLRYNQKRPGANAILVAIATGAVATSWIPGALAATDYSGPPLSYTIFGPGDGCVDDANMVSTGQTIAASSIAGESSVCETDVYDTSDADGPIEAYTKITIPDCGNDVVRAMVFDCKDSACTECDSIPESDFTQGVQNIKDAYNDIGTCQTFRATKNESFSYWQYDDTNTELSSVQDYFAVLYSNTCGDAWFADNILGDTGPIGGPDPDGCIPGMDFCPELDKCIQGFAETCPIEGGVAFSGGSTLSCDNGRCSTDTKCEWSDGSATFGTFYWTNLNGDVTLEDCEGITCTGCVTSDATGTNETEMDMEMDADMSDSDNAEMDAVMNEGDGMTMDGNETNSDMGMGANETDAGMADMDKMDPNGIIEKLGACVNADSGDINMECIQGVLSTLDPAIIGQLAQCAGGGSIAEMQACVEEQLSGEGGGDMTEPPMGNETMPEEGNNTMPEDTTSPGAFAASSGFVGVPAIALVAGLFL